MKRILMVGAGSCQINAIKRMKEMSYTVVAADYNIWTEAKELADIQVLADAFDEEEILKCASEYKVDGIMTTGTDQPVLIVSKVAEALGLPLFINSQTALRVTNKINMKRQFTVLNIPTAPYAVVKKDFNDSEIMHLKPPYVVKPVDSQGQRGIFKLNDIEAIRSHFGHVIKHSRSDEILVEQFYENTEITVSGWVTGGKVNVLTVTDRVTFSSDTHIGVCLCHDCPSVHLSEHESEIISITTKICSGFSIYEGPIYFQFLVGKDGILVNEIACRLGGAYEDITIPYATGIDVLKLNIDGCLGDNHDKNWAESYTFQHSKHFFSTQLFFCKPGLITEMTSIEKIRALPYVIGAGYNFRVGERLNAISNASQRAGYVIVTGTDFKSVRKNLKDMYQQLKIIDDQGNNMVIPDER